MEKAGPSKKEYGIFLFLDNRIWPENIEYFPILLTKGLGAIIDRRGEVLLFDSYEEAEQYAQENLWLPEVVGWRAEKLREHLQSFQVPLFIFDNFFNFGPSLVSSIQ